MSWSPARSKPSVDSDKRPSQHNGAENQPKLAVAQVDGVHPAFAVQEFNFPRYQSCRQAAQQPALEGLEVPALVPIV